jgi:hypothetical protein
VKWLAGAASIFLVNIPLLTEEGSINFLVARFYLATRKGRVSLPSPMGYTRARTSGNVLQGIVWQRGKTIQKREEPSYL